MTQVVRANRKKGDVFSLGCVQGNGTLVNGRNASVNRVSTGVYDVSFLQTADPSCYIVQLTLMQNSGNDDYMINYDIKTQNGFRVEVREQDNGGSPGGLRDEDFDFLVIQIN